MNLQKIATGVALAASTASLAGTIYVYQTYIAPYRSIDNQQSISQPLESRANKDLDYLSGVADNNKFDFIDTKTGKSVNVKNIAGLMLTTEVEGMGMVLYMSRGVGHHQLEQVEVTNNGTRLVITSKNIRGGSAGDLRATNSDVWGECEAEYLRLTQAAVEEARKRFSDTSKQEQSLVDRVNQR